MTKGHFALLIAALAAANEASGNSTWVQICALAVVGVAWIVEDRHKRRKP